MPLPKDQAWFPAKRYGWGWGMPTRWQGWVVVAGFFAGMYAGAFLVIPRGVPVFIGYVVVLGVIFTAICYAKGEAPSWRWGDDDSGSR